MGQTNQEGDITWKRDIIHEQTQALTFDVFIAAHSPCLWRKTRFPRSRHESPHAVDASQIFSMNPGSPYLVLSFMLVIARPYAASRLPSLTSFCIDVSAELELPVAGEYVVTHECLHGSVERMSVVSSELGVGALERRVSVRLGLLDTGECQTSASDHQLLSLFFEK